MREDFIVIISSRIDSVQRGHFSGKQLRPVFFVCLFVCFCWLHWVFAAARQLSLVAASGDYSSLWCAGISLRWLLLLPSMGSR